MRTALERLFIAHPRTVNEDYLGHAGVALRFALLLLGASLAALTHAVIPALFETTRLKHHQETACRDDRPVRPIAARLTPTSIPATRARSFLIEALQLRSWNVNLALNSMM